MSGAVVYLPRPVLSPDLRARCEQTIEWLVALLDAVDTPGADVEPTLGAAEFLAFSGCNWKRSREDADEREPDDDGEETLGWSAGMKQLDLGPNTADADNTVPERHGNGFVRCAADDMEPSLGAPELLPGDFYVSHGRCFDIPADQTDWSQGVLDDREGDLADTAEDREAGDINDEPQGTPDCLNCDPDLEPSLGAPNPARCPAAIGYVRETRPTTAKALSGQRPMIQAKAVLAICAD